jgi:sRNA-binding carbon storage regulator CsrA
MQRFEDTIGYAVKFGDEIEIRVLNVHGDQRRVGIGASNDLFANLETISKRIESERKSLVS